MATKRRADVVWEGNLMDGSGTIVSNTSGALPQLPVSWASRSEEPNGKTSPEELIAAAHAACYSMALSSGLAEAGAHRRSGSRPRRPSPSSPARGSRASRSPCAAPCPASTPRSSRRPPEDAKEDCPVSKALAGVEITLDARG